MAPLRSVLASQLMVCDMDKMAAEKTSVERIFVEQAFVEKTGETLMLDDKMSLDHCQHASYAAATDNSAINSTTIHSTQNIEQAKQLNASLVKSCCADSEGCKSGCHFALSASLFVQHAEYSPAIFSADIFQVTSGTLLVGELNPPSRPPLFLHS